jgi:hypothetical protein
MIYSPLDQFYVILLQFFIFDFISISNLSIFCIYFFLLILCVYYIFNTNSSFILSYFYFWIYINFQIKLIVCNDSYLCNFMIIWLLSITQILFFFNVFGLIPFGFTVTTHFIVSLSMSFTFFVWINVLFFMRFFFRKF